MMFYELKLLMKTVSIVLLVIAFILPVGGSGSPDTFADDQSPGVEPGKEVPALENSDERPVEKEAQNPKGVQDIFRL